MGRLKTQAFIFGLTDGLTSDSEASDKERE